MVERIQEVDRATGGFTDRCLVSSREWGGHRFYVSSQIHDHRRKRALVMIFSHPDGKEMLGRLTFNEDVTDQLLDGRETIPIGGVDGVDAQTFLRVIFDHCWEQGFRPEGFFDRPNEIMRLENHITDLRRLLKLQE